MPDKLYTEAQLQAALASGTIEIGGQRFDVKPHAPTAAADVVAPATATAHAPTPAPAVSNDIDAIIRRAKEAAPQRAAEAAAKAEAEQRIAEARAVARAMGDAQRRLMGLPARTSPLAAPTAASLAPAITTTQASTSDEADRVAEVRAMARSFNAARKKNAGTAIGSDARVTSRR